MSGTDDWQLVREPLPPFGGTGITRNSGSNLARKFISLLRGSTPDEIYYTSGVSVTNYHISQSWYYNTCTNTAFIGLECPPPPRGKRGQLKTCRGPWPESHDQIWSRLSCTCHMRSTADLRRKLRSRSRIESSLRVGRRRAIRNTMGQSGPHYGYGSSHFFR